MMFPLLCPCLHTRPCVDARHPCVEKWACYMVFTVQQYLWSGVGPEQESLTGMHLRGFPLASRGPQKQHCPLAGSGQGCTLQSDSSPQKMICHTFSSSAVFWPTSSVCPWMMTSASSNRESRFNAQCFTLSSPAFSCSCSYHLPVINLNHQRSNSNSKDKICIAGTK